MYRRKVVVTQYFSTYGGRGGGLGMNMFHKLFARCYKLGYWLRQYSILDIRRNRDMKLWQRISSTNTALSDLLPPQRTRQMRTRSHNYILPKVQTSRFKSVFINRCLFNVINN